MNEPTRQPTLTLRASSSITGRPRPTHASAAAPSTVRGGTPREHADSASERTLSSDHLLQGRSHVFISHNGERYQLRATRFGKLILTK
jgi:hemin uptake protein HemP